MKNNNGSAHRYAKFEKTFKIAIAFAKVILLELSPRNQIVITSGLAYVSAVYFVSLRMLILSTNVFF